MKSIARLLVTIACAQCVVLGAEADEHLRAANTTASSKPCSSGEANQLLERGHANFPTNGYGTPTILVAGGKALAYFELAVEKDPGCAQAYEALAQAESGFPSWPGLPPRERYPKVMEAARKAIELQSNNAAAHALLGGAAFNTGEWEQAEQELERAIALAPNEAKFHASYARFLAAMGRFEEAIQEVERARKLANGPMFNLPAAEIYYWARRYDKTIELVSPAASASSYHGFLLGWAYVGKGKWAEARSAFQTALPLSDRDAGLLMSLAYVDAADGRRQEVLPLLEEAKQKTTFMYVPVYRIAAAYLSLGDKEQALACDRGQVFFHSGTIIFPDWLQCCERSAEIALVDTKSACRRARPSGRRKTTLRQDFGGWWNVPSRPPLRYRAS